MRNAVEELAQEIPVTAACAAFGFARSSLYRLRQEPTPKTATSRNNPSQHHQALSQEERTQLLDTLHSERFQDSPPRQVWATLLNKNDYLCSVGLRLTVMKLQQQVFQVPMLSMSNQIIEIGPF